jgi:hypothetical protein
MGYNKSQAKEEEKVSDRPFTDTVRSIGRAGHDRRLQLATYRTCMSFHSCKTLLLGMFDTVVLAWQVMRKRSEERRAKKKKNWQALS